MHRSSFTVVVPIYWPWKQNPYELQFDFFDFVSHFRYAFNLNPRLPSRLQNRRNLALCRYQLPRFTAGVAADFFDTAAVHRFAHSKVDHDSELSEGGMKGRLILDLHLSIDGSDVFVPETIVYHTSAIYTKNIDSKSWPALYHDIWEVKGTLKLIGTRKVRKYRQCRK